MIKALASANPAVVNFSLGHHGWPLYEAVRFRMFVVAAVLEPGAKTSNPNDYGYVRKTPMYYAVFGGSRMIELLIDYRSPVAGTAALHNAAAYRKFDMMRLLLQHGADVNEVVDTWREMTPMHFATDRRQLEAMKLLEEYGARSDLKGKDVKTPAQLLDESTVVGS